MGLMEFGQFPPSDRVRAKHFLKSLYLSLPLLVVLASIPFISGCQQPQQPDPRKLTPMVSVEGSDTMGDLLKVWADEFMKRNPDVPVSINKGDTSQGIAALISRTTDLASASRDLSDEEVVLAHKHKVRLKKIPVARDSVAVIVNAENPVNDMTMEELKSVFAGETTNWSKLGGSDGEIDIIIREEGSGTSKFFLSHVLKRSKMSKTATTVPSIETMMDSIANNKNAIGYAGMGALSEAPGKVKSLKLQLINGGTAVGATAATAIGGYPLSRPLFMFMDQDPKPSAQKFVDFCLSDEGQKLVETAGFSSIDRK
ncbi:MAG TPA: phosphate ABC transporter substrate-binding protein [Candidatus Melainabacteria bacterium]|jgi:phosphate transport system substrate-binding protein|nr:phosphate ABC transporter substrate-binding protein [Candidatus Melainabacteria bacterium]HIN66735.1 phosphate ABC transporter substrate-binding protein [Candidatus Obscuribacterales bacterium]